MCNPACVSNAVTVLAVSQASFLQDEITPHHCQQLFRKIGVSVFMTVTVNLVGGRRHSAATIVRI